MSSSVITCNAATIVKTILANALLPSSPSPDKTQAAQRAYNANFEGEGERKISFVLEDMKALADDRGFDPSRAVALSVGGSDGSDLLALIQKTRIKGGVLLEYDNDAAEVARSHARLSDGRHFEVITGDAMQQLDTALGKAKSVFAGADTLIVLCFGVLHELPTRSPLYSHDTFFDKLFNAFPSVLVYCAEPCAQPGGQEGWPELVEIGFPPVAAADLNNLARHVRDRRFQHLTIPEPMPRTEHWVSMHRDLAVEVLHKVVRFGTMERFHHEMGERLTSFDGADMGRRVQRAIGIDKVEREFAYRTSDGFREAYKACDAKARDTDSNPLPMPVTHCRLILRRCAWSMKPPPEEPPPKMPDKEKRLEKLKAEVTDILKGSPDVLAIFESLMPKPASDTIAAEDRDGT